MGKFRMVLGVLLILMGPLLFYIAGDAESQGIDLGEVDGSRGAALFDLLGKWGMLALMVGVGISELATGRELLKSRQGKDDGTGNP
jgi:hypothetical protein